MFKFLRRIMSTNKKTNFTTVKGDAIKLFAESEGNAIFMHGANCQKIMGAGIAQQVREQLAPLYYLDQYDTRTPTQRFGSYSAVLLAKIKEQLKIGVNLYTQYLPGPNFDSYALVTALRAFKESLSLEQRATMTIYVPKIGCGIGGGTWRDIRPILKRELSDFNVVVVEFVPEKPKDESAAKIERRKNLRKV